MMDSKFSFEDDNLLIDAVEDNASLYDCQHFSYKDGWVRDSIWRAIAAKLNKTDEECKKRWKHIRDSYNRYKRKRKCNGGAPTKAKNSKWEFFERMRFLEKVPTERNTECGISSDPDCDSLSSPIFTEPSITIIEPQLSDIPNSPITTPLSVKRSGVTKRRDIRFQLMKKRDENRQKLLQRLNLSKREDRNDEDSTFGTHVTSVLKKLPPRLKLQAKNEIFYILTKFETQHLDIQEERRASFSQ